jgi:hypothetical protein
MADEIRVNQAFFNKKRNDAYYRKRGKRPN